MKDHEMSLATIEAIDSEREYQERKWPDHKHTIAEWLLIMEKCLNDAKRVWTTQHGEQADFNTMCEIRQVVAVGVAAMDQHGVPKRAPQTVIWQEPDELERERPCIGATIQ